MAPARSRSWLELPRARDCLWSEAVFHPGCQGRAERERGAASGTPVPGIDSPSPAAQRRRCRREGEDELGSFSIPKILQGRAPPEAPAALKFPPVRIFLVLNRVQPSGGSHTPEILAVRIILFYFNLI